MALTPEEKALKKKLRTETKLKKLADLKTKLNLRLIKAELKSHKLKGKLK